MVKLPKKCRQMGAAAHQVHLPLIFDGLLVTPQFLDGRLHRSRLQVDPSVCQMICGIVHGEPDLSHSANKVCWRHVRHSPFVSCHVPLICSAVCPGCLDAGPCGRTGIPSRIESLRNDRCELVDDTQEYVEGRLGSGSPKE